MPKGFTEREKKIIRQNLFTAGISLFGRLGLKKTTVQELAAAAGIAKGSFYLFYPSKEVLFMEIMHRFEQQVQTDMLQELQTAMTDPKKTLKSILIKQFELAEEHPILKTMLNSGEMEYLHRKLPPDLRRENLEIDYRFAEKLLAGWQQAGLLKQVDFKHITGVFRGLFFLTLHKEDIGAENFNGTFHFLLDSILDSIFKA